MSDDAFDVRTDHSFGPSRYLEDFIVGETFYIPSRTMTDALFAAFQLVSGDNDPIHYDAQYCQDRGHPGLLAHGMQTMIQTAAGAGTFPHQVADSIGGLLDHRFHHFLAAHSLSGADGVLYMTGEIIKWIQNAGNSSLSPCAAGDPVATGTLSLSTLKVTETLKSPKWGRQDFYFDQSL